MESSNYFYDEIIPSLQVGWDATAQFLASAMHTKNMFPHKIGEILGYEVFLSPVDNKITVNLSEGYEFVAELDEYTEEFEDEALNYISIAQISDDINGVVLEQYQEDVKG